MTIKEYFASRKQEIRDSLFSLKVKPHFVVVQVNDDPASNAYVKGKLKDSKELGINAELIKLPESTIEKELLK